MKICQLVKMLQDTVMRGPNFSNDEVKVFDHELQRLESVTGMRYGGSDGVVELLTEKIFEEEP